MVKKLSWFMAALCAIFISSSLCAQEAQPETAVTLDAGVVASVPAENTGGGHNSRKLNKITLLLDFNTGTLVNDTTGIMTGNGLDARISYDRGFQSMVL